MFIQRESPIVGPIPAPSHALMPPAAFDVLATHQQIYTREHVKYGKGKMSLRPSQKPIKKKKKLFIFLNSGGFLVQNREIMASRRVVRNSVATAGSLLSNTATCPQ